MRQLKYLLVPLVLILLIPPFRIHAQNESVVLTLAVPQYAKDFFSDKLLAEFEAAHPGVEVQIVFSNNARIAFGGGVGQDIED